MERNRQPDALRSHSNRRLLALCAVSLHLAAPVCVCTVGLIFLPELIKREFFGGPIFE